ncbi:sigma-70 family RNA polymerase sigma factor [Chitinophaga sp. SYP-B3965]|uniref:RNA polymerase sigma factor n=1 Tax=Chitinophaga sp. SYP-B3965 TaxID=2663120 RepID=UPI001299F1FD|nr:sigma-70 family RNA polymerase sigma factor [Chitinophaga sp. SYP-B3965]MRG44390.1 sigma-70 family RNA polymerase sigma factor [Chitinophaga sp. SYP-B3965]
MPTNFLHIDHPDLLSSIADGNEKAMEILFHAYYPRLKYFCLDLMKDAAEAQDIAQDAIAAFWDRREGFRDATVKAAGTFLFTVARNKCLDHKKHLQVRLAKQDEIAGGQEISEDVLEATIIKEDLFNRIFQEVEGLPPNQVELLKMIFVEGLDTLEIAQKLGITPNNVRNQKARALEKLRAVLLKKRLILPFFYLFMKSL